MLKMGSQCRLCCQFGDRYYPILDTTSGKNIELKMYECLSLTVNKEDSKPKEICHSCYVKLNGFYEFALLCHESDKNFERELVQLNNRLKKEDNEAAEPPNCPQSETLLRPPIEFCKLPENPVSVKEEQKPKNTDHIKKINRIKKKYVCQYCKKDFTRTSSLNGHLSLYCKAKPVSFDLYSETFASKYHLKKLNEEAESLYDLKPLHPTQSSKVLQNENENAYGYNTFRPLPTILIRCHTLKQGPSRRRCVSCYRKISNEHGREAAQRRATNIKWKCQQCDKYFCVSCFEETHPKI